MRIGDLGFGDYVAYGAEGVEAFCYGPGEAFLFGFVLHVAGGEVDGDHVACVVSMMLAMHEHHDLREDILVGICMLLCVEMCVVDLEIHTINRFDRLLRVPRIKVAHCLANH